MVSPEELIQTIYCFALYAQGLWKGNCMAVIPKINYSFLPFPVSVLTIPSITLSHK
jgi:hypothetical protein